MIRIDMVPVYGKNDVSYKESKYQKSGFIGSFCRYSIMHCNKGYLFYVW